MTDLRVVQCTTTGCGWIPCPCPRPLLWPPLQITSESGMLTFSRKPESPLLPCLHHKGRLLVSSPLLMREFAAPFQKFPESEPTGWPVVRHRLRIKQVTQLFLFQIVVKYASQKMDDFSGFYMYSPEAVSTSMSLWDHPLHPSPEVFIFPR